MTIDNNAATEPKGLAKTLDREPLIRAGWLRALLFIVTLVVLAFVAGSVVYLVQNLSTEETATESVVTDNSGVPEEAGQTEELVDPESEEPAGEAIETEKAVETEAAIESEVSAETEASEPIAEDKPVGQAEQTEESKQNISTGEIDNIAQTAIMALVMFGLIALFRRYVDRQSLGSLGLAWDRQKGLDAIWGMFWGIGLITSVFLISLAMGVIEIEKINPPSGYLITMFFVFVLAGFTEEIMFRGYLLNNLMASVNKYVALLIIASLFGISHATNPNASVVGILNIVLAGLLLGIYYVHVKNLWFPVGMHLTWNFFQGPIYGASVSGIETESIINLNLLGSDLMTGGEFGFEASLPATFVIIAAIIIIHLKYREKPKPVSDNPAIVSD